MNMDKLTLTESSSIKRWRPMFVGCPTSLNMGHVHRKSGIDAARSAHSTPSQRWLTR